MGTEEEKTISITTDQDNSSTVYVTLPFTKTTLDFIQIMADLSTENGDINTFIEYSLRTQKWILEGQTLREKLARLKPDMLDYLQKAPEKEGEIQVLDEFISPEKMHLARQFFE